MVRKMITKQYVDILPAWEELVGFFSAEELCVANRTVTHYVVVACEYTGDIQIFHAKCKHLSSPL